MLTKRVEKKPASLKKQKFLMSFFALERFWKAARQSKSFPSYFFLCLFLVFFSATDFSSAFQFQTQNIIFCSSDPEFWRSDKMHNEAWNFEFTFKQKKLSIYCIVMKQKQMLLFRKSEILHFKVLVTKFLPHICFKNKTFLFVKIES